jgi:hypothetical protein
MCPVKSHGAYALKNIQKVPSTRKTFTLTKGVACWPCHSQQQRWRNTEKAGPKSVVPRKHQFAWTVGDPLSPP